MILKWRIAVDKEHRYTIISVFLGNHGDIKASVKQKGEGFRDGLNQYIFYLKADVL